MGHLGSRGWVKMDRGLAGAACARCLLCLLTLEHKGRTLCPSRQGGSGLLGPC